MSRPPTCQCNHQNCRKCKARAYGQAWRNRNPDYMRDAYDIRNPGSAERRQRRYLGRHTWTPDEDSLLGTDHDHIVAEVIGVSTSAAGNRRAKLGIPKYRRTRTVKDRGYVLIGLPPGDPYHDMANSSGYVMEHRHVMARHLQRPLTRDEFVHHRNGIKHDNRIQNLELWTRSHPDGQRVEDVLDWARGFIERYEMDAVFKQENLV